jgi:hypothetical protein
MENHQKKILGKPSNCGPLPLSIAEENSNRLFDLCDQLRLGFQATLNIRSSLSPPGWYSWKHGNEDPKTLATSFSAPKTLELQHHVQLNRKWELAGPHKYQTPNLVRSGWYDGINIYKPSPILGFHQLDFNGGLSIDVSNYYRILIDCLLHKLFRCGVRKGFFALWSSTICLWYGFVQRDISRSWIERYCSNPFKGKWFFLSFQHVHTAPGSQSWWKLTHL